MALYKACAASIHPASPHLNGLLSFQSLTEIDEAFENVARFAIEDEIKLGKFQEQGSEKLGLKPRDARNIVQSMFRAASEKMCRDRGLLEYRFSKAAGFHATRGQARIGQKIPWGTQGDRRSSMLRNEAGGHVWQYGVTGLPADWPIPHFKLKSRVLFAPPKGDDAGEVYADHRKQHRLRRSVCKGWRNKQWHGRMMAFIELLSGDAAFIRLPLGEEAHVKLDPTPILFTSPVSTVLPNKLGDEDEEGDPTTLGRPESDEDQ
jgi:hypothetical protein